MITSALPTVARACLLLVLAVPWSVHADDTTTSAGDLRLETSNPSKGRYRLWASETIQARASVLEALLLAPKCADGCELRVPNVTRAVPVEAPEGSTAGAVYAWSFIDHVVNSSYFTVTSVEREPGISRIDVRIPPVAELEALASEGHLHEPLFPRHVTSWVLTEEFDASGRFLHTRVEVEMRMESQRWIVNVMPGRVLDGAADHMRAVFTLLRAAEPPRLEPASEAEPP